MHHYLYLNRKNNLTLPYIDVTQFENELIDCMKRIYSLTKRIAKLTVPESLIHEAD